MSPNWKKTSQALALLLIGALVQVYVLAIPAASATATASEDGASTVETSAPLFGRLSVYGEGGVTVNGNVVTSGTTVFSGAQLQTSEKTGATVSLYPAGSLDIAPNTNLELTFDRSQINVRVIGGDALLSTGEGVKGSLTTPDGRTQVTDATSASTLGGATYLGDDAEPQTRKSHPCRIAGMPCALFWTMVGGGSAVALFFALRRGRNPSPGTPRGRP
jgi:hypothetical protein